MSPLRRKFALEARQAQLDWALRDPDGPNGRALREELRLLRAKLDSYGYSADPRADELRFQLAFLEKYLPRQSRPSNSQSAPLRAPTEKCDVGPEGNEKGEVEKCDTLTNPKPGNPRVCRICGHPFHSTRPDASLCSARCRKRASRSNQPKTPKHPFETARVSHIIPLGIGSQT